MVLLSKIQVPICLVPKFSHQFPCWKGVNSMRAPQCPFMLGVNTPLVDCALVSQYSRTDLVISLKFDLEVKKGSPKCFSEQSMQLHIFT